MIFFWGFPSRLGDSSFMMGISFARAAFFSLCNFFFRRNCSILICRNVFMALQAEWQIDRVLRLIATNDKSMVIMRDTIKMTDRTM